MTEKEILKRIYPSVVTCYADWRLMVKAVDRLGLEDISLFLTKAGFRERQGIYQALQKTKVKRIPHVHIRHDFREAELDFLVKTFKSKVFTTHCQYFKSFAKSKHRKKIFIENNNGQHRIKDLKVLGQAGGACIDLAHLEEFRLTAKNYYEISERAARTYKVGCNHLSAVLPGGKSWHRASKASDLAYVANIPKFYFSRYINLELTNPIPEQLKFRKYLAKLLAKQWNKKS
ncbi:MAG: hypothetical protein WC768_01245 [Patescibacteria group bacterium]|jgi:hypothetical protein